jgi:hypothetical protein
MPKSVKLVPGHAAFDDDTEMIVRDTAESLGVDPDNMSLIEQRKVAEALGFSKQQYTRRRKR